jgi:hypothetical protein
MPPMLETPLYVQPTAVLMAAVALELGVPFWAKAIVAVNSANMHRGMNFFIEIISDWDLTKLRSASPLAEHQLTSEKWSFSRLLMGNNDSCREDGQSYISRKYIGRRWAIGRLSASAPQRSSLSHEILLKQTL